MGVAVETRVGRKRVIVIPKAVADIVKISEGQKVRVVAMGDKVVIEPVRDAVWLALHGKKIGKISPEEVEEESLIEQEKLLNKQ
ncbi:MAG: AbrB/MazE/SpoVT family DNA-binding domain-containing protein [Thermoprotei archaeon]|nr:MAG: AbrB/MazE/SpoVT family DNA-binding domain-containing protein [Thermoprotei archaeon]